jgi:hypothetical protein
MSDEPQYTAGEKIRLAALIARGAKRSLAGEGVYLADLDRRIERIKEGARKRTAKEAGR